MSILLDRGIDPNRGCRKWGRPPILKVLLLKHYEMSRTEMVERTDLLFHHGADIFLEDVDGNCALFEAARKDPRTFVIPGMKADMTYRSGQLEGSQESSDTNRRRLHWDEWEKAKRVDDWDEAKELAMQDRGSALRRDVKVAIMRAAFEVLADKFLSRCKGMFIGDDDEVGKRRRLMATIMRGCREVGAAVDPKYYDNLVALC